MGLVQGDEQARRAADAVAGGGGLTGLRRLTEAIATMEERRTMIIEELRRRQVSWEEISRLVA